MYIIKSVCISPQGIDENLMRTHSLSDNFKLHTIPKLSNQNDVQHVYLMKKNQKCLYYPLMVHSIKRGTENLLLQIKP